MAKKICILSVTHTGTGFVHQILRRDYGLSGNKDIGVLHVPRFQNPPLPGIVKHLPTVAVKRSPVDHLFSCLRRGEPHHLGAFRTLKQWLTDSPEIFQVSIPHAKADREALQDFLTEAVGHEPLQEIDWTPPAGYPGGGVYDDMVEEWKTNGTIPPELQEDLDLYDLDHDFWDEV